jgi:hypothetical protein
MRIPVIDDLPPRNISKQSALRLELTGWYELRNRRLYKLPQRRILATPPTHQFIPAVLPPEELPNCRFRISKRNIGLQGRPA